MRRATTGKPAGKDRERRIQITLGDQPRREQVIPADQADVMQIVDLTPHLRPGVQRLTLADSTETAPGYQVTFLHYMPGHGAEAKREPPRFR